MSSVSERPRVRERITEGDWRSDDISTVSPQRATLAGRASSFRRYVFPFPQGQLIVECDEPLPRWFRDTVERLNELAQLPECWDSYRAPRIRPSGILAAIELLLNIMRDDTPPPSAVPTNRGTVLLEWHTRGVDLEVDVLGPGRLHVAFEDARAGVEWDAEVGTNLTRLVECVERLSTVD